MNVAKGQLHSLPCVLSRCQVVLKVKLGYLVILFNKFTFYLLRFNLPSLRNDEVAITTLPPLS